MIVNSVPYATELRSLAPVAVIVPSPSLVRETAKLFFVKVALTIILSVTTTFLEAVMSAPPAVMDTSS